MTARIHLLPAALADQIAAGEVIERPSSVVKELVENSLDAGARRVEVEIDRGGLGRIVVSDDGEGMSAEDAHLALRRHATSKLRSAEELFALRSFGFRGEALPSIASISELRLLTRPREQTAGYELVVRAGEVQRAGEQGAPAGTRIEVRELFANVPARLKFQKNVATEAGHVLDALVRCALTAPAVHFKLRIDGRLSLELPSHVSLAERAQAVLRRTAGRGVRLASAALKEGAISVEVHLAPPEQAVLSARRVHLLVNRRLVRDRGLLSAVQVGLGELLPRGRHPLAVVALELPPVDVDVNVHPQKTEVRLARAAEAHAAVRHAIARAVADAGYSALAEDAAASRYAVEAAPPLSARDAPGEEDEGYAYAVERGRAYELVCAMADAAGPPPAGVERSPVAPRFLGAIPGGYLAFVDPAGLVLLDQHVASALLLAVLGQDAERRPLTGSDEELEVARMEGGDEEFRARAITLAARSPADPVDAESATRLYAELRGLAEEGRLPPLDEARWRGRAACLRLARAEIGQRLDG